MSEWKKARKKPVEIEFREVNPTDCVTDALTGEVVEENVEIVKTLEGKYIARPNNDFIIRGVHGEVYPIKKDIFAQTYELGSSYPTEFAEFYNAMLLKMQQKAEENGDSWKYPVYQELYYRYSSMPPAVVREMPMVDFLKERLLGEIEEWKENSDPKELVDIANFCAMLYLRLTSDNSKPTEAKT